MIIRSVEFAGSVASPKNPLPGDLPQVAFSGRSNVGKSSLINTLLRRTRKKVAHVSSKPGKTQMLNFYRVNDRFFLVDLPGFGYAKAPGPVRDSWKRLVEWYLASPDGPRGVVHLVDGRHPPFRLDQEMMEYLGELGVPALVVLTKMDRVPKGKRERTLKKAAGDLGLAAEQLLPFSSKTGEGRDSLLEALDHLLPSENS
ncbi:MAG: YihA family ribosome biogenesis GTP-binding protein [Gemmatimonadetes bacterium]|nr:YihA family ribosome biogenesis GTP-binding protein [Gemmatimonadota bacterium]